MRLSFLLLASLSIGCAPVPTIEEGFDDSPDIAEEAGHDALEKKCNGIGGCERDWEYYSNCSFTNQVGWKSFSCGPGYQSGGSSSVYFYKFGYGPNDCAGDPGCQIYAQQCCNGVSTCLEGTCPGSCL